jgi:hypothetical protein
MMERTCGVGEESVPKIDSIWSIIYNSTPKFSVMPAKITYFVLKNMDSLLHELFSAPIFRRKKEKISELMMTKVNRTIMEWANVFNDW